MKYKYYFPQPLLDVLCKYQQSQGNPVNPEIFFNDNCADKMAGGFDWDKTEEGDEWWYEVLVQCDYERFFERYNEKLEVHIKDVAKKFNVPVENLIIKYDEE